MIIVILSPLKEMKPAEVEEKTEDGGEKVVIYWLCVLFKLNPNLINDFISYVVCFQLMESELDCILIKDLLACFLIESIRWLMELVWEGWIFHLLVIYDLM